MCISVPYFFAERMKLTLHPPFTLSLSTPHSVFLALFESAEAACCCVERKHVVFVSRDWVSGTMICTWGLKEDGRGWRGNGTLRLKTL